jgi:hypothetical protein
MTLKTKREVSMGFNETQCMALNECVVARLMMLVFEVGKSGGACRLYSGVSGESFGVVAASRR